ncbi:hypothetical protein [Flavobacterium lacustre]|uniref:hypothetical protein n=1 Tax=Flavobacterium lacustre TaxID=3016339 RepID=UPI0022B69B3D|nr:hypothetical protein [Flavobacterium lacustre]
MDHRNIYSVSDYIIKFKDVQYKELNAGVTVNGRFPKFLPSLTPLVLWNFFIIEYEIVNKRKFIISYESKAFVYTVMYYFLQSSKFYNSPLFYPVPNCEISLKKGLLIVGGVGVGKTSIMKTIVSLICKCSLNFDQQPVRMHNTLDIVEEFESCNNMSRNDVIIKYSKSFRVFDDVKNEREASNYGKVDLFKDILYKRSECKNFRTVILCNYESEFNGDMYQAIEGFGRYGDRNYDRLFEAFNFIEFKGTSNRK